jgi:hypothetical protein
MCGVTTRDGLVHLALNAHAALRGPMRAAGRWPKHNRGAAQPSGFRTE